jgi:hypothetical protein
MQVKKLLAVVIGAGAISAQASTFDGSLSNQSVKVDVSIDRKTYFLDTGAMYHTDDGRYGYIGAHIEDTETTKDYPLQIGLAGRLVAVDGEYSDNDEGFAIALGGFYRYTFPKANRFSLYASAYYAPEVLSFTNVDYLYQGEVRGEYRTLRNARVFVRYGQTGVKFTSFEDVAEMNSEVALGVVATF